MNLKQLLNSPLSRAGVRQLVVETPMLLGIRIEHGLLGHVEMSCGSSFVVYLAPVSGQL